MTSRTCSTVRAKRAKQVTMTLAQGDRRRDVEESSRRFLQRQLLAESQSRRSFRASFGERDAQLCQVSPRAYGTWRLLTFIPSRNESRFWVAVLFFPFFLPFITFSMTPCRASKCRVFGAGVFLTGSESWRSCMSPNSPLKKSHLGVGIPCMLYSVYDAQR
jgi:hypothetical protein